MPDIPSGSHLAFQPPSIQARPPWLMCAGKCYVDQVSTGRQMHATHNAPQRQRAGAERQSAARTLASCSLPACESGRSSAAWRTKKASTRRARRSTSAAAKLGTCGDGTGLNFDRNSILPIEAHNQNGMRMHMVELLISAEHVHGICSHVTTLVWQQSVHEDRIGGYDGMLGAWPRSIPAGGIWARRAGHVRKSVAASLASI